MPRQGDGETNDDLIARAEISIDAPDDVVWQALVNPEAIKVYFFGAQVISEWHEGSPIVWKGDWKGTAYEDHGRILRIQPERLLQYSHFSALAGVPDKPENYHTVTVELSSDGLKTHVSLTQDNNSSTEERQHSEKNWEMMLENLKNYIEVSLRQSRHAGNSVNPQMKRLSSLVGEWDIVALKGELRQAGRARFVWLDEGAFLSEHWDFKPAGLPPEGTWIIGSDESTETYGVLYHDARGVSRILQMSMENDTWKMWRDDPHFAQRLTGIFSQDGNTIQVKLEKSIDGGDWEHDFDLVFTRLK